MYKHASLVLLALILVFGTGVESVQAFGIPDFNKKKDKKKSRRKKKSDDEARKKEEASKAEEKKTEEAKAEETKKAQSTTTAEKSETGKADSDASKKTAGAAKETEIQVTEIPLQKETWAIYKDLKVGDFTLYEYGAKQDMTTRNEVIATDEKSVTVLTTSNMAGRITKAKMRYVLNIVVKTSEKTVSVAGKQIKVKVMESYKNGKLLNRIISSKEVPLGGLVRNEDENGKPYMVLKDFKKQ